MDRRSCQTGDRGGEIAHRSIDDDLRRAVSTDDGATFKGAGTIATSFTITTVSGGTAALVNGTSYTVRVRARNAIGVGPATAGASGTPVASAVAQAFMRSARSGPTVIA